jgi:predicted CoA-substrate-specific enzyme activase
MRLTLGIDIGAISVKAAILADCGSRLDTLGAGFRPLAGAREGFVVAVSPYRRLRGDPVRAVSDLLGDLPLDPGGFESAAVGVTGAGAALFASRLGLAPENEFRAIARAATVLCPEVRTVFEMGGESSKLLRLNRDGRILDYENNGDCAAGTGSFIDQQATRLRYTMEEVGAIALSARSTARIAGRCSVFAKTDMIHAQQKGATPPEILKGLAEAVARNFKASIVRGREVTPPVAFIGGLAANASVVQALREAFGLGDALIVPEAYAWFGAVGAALLARGEPVSLRLFSSAVEGTAFTEAVPSLPPLSLDRVVLLREHRPPGFVATGGGMVDVALGVDVGSVSTNFALVDREGRLLHEIYVRTDGRPIQVVSEGLDTIRREMGDRIRISGVGTTGSGRELIGEMVGADAVHDEITAHKAGALHVSRALNGFAGAPDGVDTIFEIGGQDAKFIRLEDDVVVDFTMNEACAAGTGSFLEEQAERLGVAIIGEFSRLALSSSRPIRLGERCTVFMEQDVNAWVKRGAPVQDLVAGLAYSVALNYLNRVVRGRKIGKAIYFQGGTAYNDAVAAAFAGLLDRPIVVPPHNGVIGAIGAALLAWERVGRSGAPSRFRGFDLGHVRYALREFVCRACANVCDMQELTVEGVKTYWGDRCSWKFRRRASGERTPVIDDLLAWRERQLWGEPEAPGGGPIVTVPRCMGFYDDFPFWHAYLRTLGCSVLRSDATHSRTVRAGQELAVAEPCFPVKVAHGHFAELLEKEPHWILAPSVIDAEAPRWTVASERCPWSQTLPFVLRALERAGPWRDRVLAPTVRFREGPASVRSSLRQLGRTLGASHRLSDQAVEAGYDAQTAFKRAVQQTGREALLRVNEAREPALVLLGRSYNLYDRAVNMDLAGKLREHYGMNVIPLDFLPLEDEDIRDLNDNMFWNSGWKILAAARIAGKAASLEAIYVTNFKCGPDSYIKHFVGDALGRPFLTLQFDGHGNDAGMLTRCEAYLESKRCLRR